jgi:cellulose synthase/poly-beta-1,6-N-acetylglucosamine synthase-like glycosyltransferase
MQDYNNSNYEVIIADDNSTDETFQVASDFKGIANLKTVRNKGRGKKLALRTAIELASNNIIVTTDADCTFGKSWLTIIAKTLSDKEPDMILLPVKLKSEVSWFNQLQQIEYLSLQGVTAGTAMLGEPVMCNGAGLVFTKDAYLRNSDKLHDEINSGDDVFLLYALKMEKKTKTTWLGTSEAVVTTEAAGSLGSFIRQRVRWASKAGAITDKNTMLLGIVTFVTILAQVFMVAASVFSTVWLYPLITLTLLKAVPDYLIINETARQYNIRGIMQWFPVAALLYPFYLITVFVATLWGVSSPFRRGI